jgi:hypothetical protein
VFRETTTLVTVPCVVTDERGVTINDLKIDDFRLYVNGVRRKYLDFVVNNDAAGAQTFASPEGLNVAFTNASYTPEPGFYGTLALGLSGMLVAVRRRKIA